MKQVIKEIFSVLAHLAWRGFGLFLFIFGGSAGVGAALTGSWTTGVVVAWGTLMIGVLGVLGYAIATTGRASKSDVEKGIRDAIEKANEQQKKYSSCMATYRYFLADLLSNQVIAECKRQAGQQNPAQLAQITLSSYKRDVYAPTKITRSKEKNAIAALPAIPTSIFCATRQCPSPAFVQPEI